MRFTFFGLFGIVMILSSALCGNSSLRSPSKTNIQYPSVFFDEGDQNSLCSDFIVLLRVMVKDGISQFYANGTEEQHNQRIAQKINRTCNSRTIGDFSIDAATYAAFKTDKECFTAMDSAVRGIGSMDEERLLNEGASEFKKARDVCENFFKGY